MNEQQLRPEWFGEWHADALLAEAAGIQPADLSFEALRALGNFATIDPIENDIYAQHLDITRQWFLIGFVLGQNPGRLVVREGG